MKKDPNNKTNNALTISADDTSYDLKIQDRIAMIQSNEFATEDEVNDQRSEMERIQDAESRLKAAMNISKGHRNWGYSAAGDMSKAIISKHLNSMKTGLYSTFPILCKGATCPYAEQCIAFKNNLHPPIGEPCVMETDKIERLIDGYCREFDFVSCTMTDFLTINELVMLDILIDRCQRLMSKELSPVIDVNIGISNTGDVITQPQISKNMEAYEKMSKRRSQLLDELMATRKANKNKDQTSEEDEMMSALERLNDPNFVKVEERPEQFKNKGAENANS